MNKNTAIEIKNLSKQYKLGTVSTGTLSHDLKRWWHLARGKEDPFLKIGDTNDRSLKSDSGYVWALKDINFEVQQGEVLGIIGKNGAGKSTLLKILSRVTGPTTGKINYRGRIGALLEVGTGFHPELTGRENIFLNGAILGMTRAEIKAKFDEIVDFSGCGKYVDTPVKRYSSGMMVRLGFAVAAFLEPEILVVDEVLAVGDAEFQKKAIGKMQDVSSQDGRTVLFVSHNMASIKSLCKSGVVLENGQLVFEGNQMAAVEYYQKNSVLNKSYEHNGDLKDALGNNRIKILKLLVEPLKGNIIEISSGFEIKLRFYTEYEKINLDVTFVVKTIDEMHVFNHGALVSKSNDLSSGYYDISAKIPGYILNAGVYKVGLLFGQNQRIELLNATDLVEFEINNEVYGSNARKSPGIVKPDVRYKINYFELDSDDDKERY